MYSEFGLLILFEKRSNKDFDKLCVTHKLCFINWHLPQVKCHMHATVVSKVYSFIYLNGDNAYKNNTLISVWWRKCPSVGKCPRVLKYVHDPNMFC